jgi:hypothetical protein
MFAEHPEVLDRLFKRFSYLQDYPLNIRGKLIEEAQYYGSLATDDFLGFLMGYPEEACLFRHDHFPFLNAKENEQLSHYQLLNPVIPWPTPKVGIQSNQVTGTHSIDVIMHQVGTCQLYWGGEIGVLWEAILYPDIRARIEFEAIMNQLWGFCEQILFSHGVTKIVTYNRDPEYPNE